ncbi:hypothetical protein [Bacteroides sp.]|uniref:hypothetical protein n=1 Tax=Bacteroides sp. TaxID=29523 RepID=UPI0025BDECDC|nr:hypothetical protein [Bacteroides sp.]
MRTIYLITLIFVLFSSCSDEVADGTNILINEPCLSGSIKMSDFPYSFEIDGKKIVIDIQDDSLCYKQPITRGIQIFGPFDVKCDYKKLFTNYKVPIVHEPTVASGVYLCDVYYFSKSVPIPTDAGGLRVLSPNPSGYIDYDTQELGINWAWQPGDNSLTVYFYTMIVKYNIAGAAMGWIIPCPGEDVTITYSYLRYIE